MVLTLHPSVHGGSGHDRDKWDHAYKYEVQGLPSDRKAEVIEHRHQWTYILTGNGVQGKATGPFLTREKALEALEVDLAG